MNDEHPESRDRPVALDDGDDLDDLLAHAGADRVLVEFYTKGCGICASMEPVLTNVAKVVDATVATINPGDDLSLAEEYGVRRVPTFVLFEDGIEVARVDDGFVGADRLVRFVETGDPGADAGDSEDAGTALGGE
jgi:thiol-disulfide isomerase/thioredoxin